ncbi:unnamed protein product [Ilex paraguariensis]|uniref:Single-stranded DNA-binding protein n=1 Tax=Ilex paraguariensis TaxID=185542 RepID=A0ABC8S127_9AQUA
MSSLAAKFVKFLRVSTFTRPTSSFVVGEQGGSKLLYSTSTFDGDNGDDVKNNEGDEFDDDFLPDKPELQLQSVDPRRGWGFRGVHKAIICGKIGQAPVQKILRNGRTVTIFTVGTGGLYDQRIVGAKDLPKPAQWHRIAVHNEILGAYAVQQLAKKENSLYKSRGKHQQYFI